MDPLKKEIIKMFIKFPMIGAVMMILGGSICTASFYFLDWFNDRPYFLIIPYFGIGGLIMGFCQSCQYYSLIKKAEKNSKKS